MYTVQRLLEGTTEFRVPANVFAKATQPHTSEIP